MQSFRGREACSPLSPREVSLLLVVTMCWAASADAAQTFNDVFGPRYKPAPGRRRLPERPQRAHDAAEALLRWNKIAVDASGLDHTPVAPVRAGNSASNSALGARAGRWRWCTSRCSTRSMQSFRGTSPTRA